MSSKFFGNSKEKQPTKGVKQTFNKSTRGKSTNSGVKKAGRGK